METIQSFAASYINDPVQRTKERNAVIEDAAAKYLGKLKTCSCEDWYLDQLLLLIKIMDRKSEYVLKAGVVMDIPFTHEGLTISAFNITDELAELHLATDPSKLRNFTEYPKNAKGAWKVPSVSALEAMAEEHGVTIHEDVMEAAQTNAKNVAAMQKANADKAKKADVAGAKPKAKVATEVVSASTAQATNEGTAEGAEAGAKGAESTDELGNI